MNTFSNAYHKPSDLNLLKAKKLSAYSNWPVMVLNYNTVIKWHNFPVHFIENYG